MKGLTAPDPWRIWVFMSSTSQVLSPRECGRHTRARLRSPEDEKRGDAEERSRSKRCAGKIDSRTRCGEHPEQVGEQQRRDDRGQTADARERPLQFALFVFGDLARHDSLQRRPGKTGERP